MAWRDAFAEQARACRSLGSPLTAQVCEALAEILAHDHGALAERIRNWPGDPSYRADSVPLRLCGALHALVLTGQTQGLAGAYKRSDASVLRKEISKAIQRHEQHILEWIEHAPQTNEVARSAVLIAGSWFLAALLPDCRFDLLELGASAGINLNFPFYNIEIKNNNFLYEYSDTVCLSPEWRGKQPLRAKLLIGSARGVDLHPLDPTRDGLRLLAYIWADQHERLQRMRAALAVAKRHPVRVDRDDAGHWLSRQLAEPCPHGRLVYHTVAAQYFPTSTRDQVEAALDIAGADTSTDRPLAHLSMESDGGEGAALTLRLWTGGEMRRWSLGRADFHARWIDWQPEEI